MALDPIKHYSLTSPASIYDEEALTALELAARTAAKVNDAVEAYNELEESVPVQIADQVKEHIEGGTFDAQISEHLGDLDEQVENLLGSVPVGGTSMDAEIIDARRNNFGRNHANLGAELRTHELEIALAANGSAYVGTNGRMQIYPDGATGALRVHFDHPINVKIPISNEEHGTSWANYQSGVYELDEDTTAGMTKGATIEIPAYNVLVYRHVGKDGLVYESDQEGLGCVALNSVHGGDIVLLANSWARPIGGKLLEIETYEIARDTDVTVKALSGKDRATVYVSANGRIDFEEYNPAAAGGLKITLGNCLTVKDELGANGIDWDVIGAQLGSALSIDAGNKDAATITLADSHKLLVYNMTDRLLYIRAGHTALKADDIVLVHNTWSVPVAGVLVDAYVRQTADRAEGLAGVALTTAQKALAGVGSGIAPRWDFPVEAIKQHAKNLTEDCLINVSILYFTDPHLAEGDGWETELEEYAQHLERIYNASNFDLVVCGGDWLGNGDTVDEAKYKLARVDARMRAAFGAKYIPVNGNHDTNYQGEAMIPYDQIARLMGKTSDLTTDTFMPYYAVALDKCVVVVLDSGTDWTDANASTVSDYVLGQVEWLNEILETTHKGAPVLVFTHMASNDKKNPSNLTEIHNIIRENLANHNMLRLQNPTENSGFAPCIFSGHLHTDEVVHIPNYEDVEPHVFIMPNLKKEVPTAALVTVSFNLSGIGMSGERVRIVLTNGTGQNVVDQHLTDF